METGECLVLLAEMQAADIKVGGNGLFQVVMKIEKEQVTEGGLNAHL